MAATNALPYPCCACGTSFTHTKGNLRLVPPHIHTIHLPGLDLRVTRDDFICDPCRLAYCVRGSPTVSASSSRAKAARGVANNPRASVWAPTSSSNATKRAKLSEPVQLPHAELLMYMNEKISPTTTFAQKSRSVKRKRSQHEIDGPLTSNPISIDNSRDSQNDDLALAMSLSDAVTKSEQKSDMKLLGELYTAISTAEAELNVKFVLNPVVKDGNCMFSCLVSSLGEAVGQFPKRTDFPRNHSEMRSFLVNQLKVQRNEKFTIKSTDATLEDHISLAFPGLLSFDDCVDRMVVNSTHGQQFELMVASRAFMVNIEIYCLGPRPIKLTPSKNPRTNRAAPTIRLALTFRPEHYEWIGILS